VEINKKMLSNTRELTISAWVVSKAMKNNFQFIVSGDAGWKSFERRATLPFTLLGCLPDDHLPPLPPHPRLVLRVALRLGCVIAART
jgi:hypothetical protein